MAFALLANLPPVNGLYSSFFPLVTYFFLGGIHQMVPGEELSAQNTVCAPELGRLLCQGVWDPWFRLHSWMSPQ